MMESPENERKLKKTRSDKQRRNSSKRSSSSSRRHSRECLLTVPLEDSLQEMKLSLDEESPTVIRRAGDDTPVPFIKCISSDAINETKGERQRTRRSFSLHRTKDAIPQDHTDRDMALSLVSSCPTSSCSSSGTSMSIESTTTPPNSGGRGGKSIYPLLASSNGGNVTGSREKLKYTQHKDGLLHENKTPFDDVDFCFRCDPPVSLPNPDEELIKCIEKTGFKFDMDGSGHISVYRTVFLCAECVVWLKEAKKSDSTLTLSISPRAKSYYL